MCIYSKVVLVCVFLTGTAVSCYATASTLLVSETIHRAEEQPTLTQRKSNIQARASTEGRSEANIEKHITQPNLPITNGDVTTSTYNITSESGAINTVTVVKTQNSTQNSIVISSTTGSLLSISNPPNGVKTVQFQDPAKKRDVTATQNPGSTDWTITGSTLNGTLSLDGNGYVFSGTKNGIVVTSSLSGSAVNVDVTGFQNALSEAVPDEYREIKEFMLSLSMLLGV